ncbi:MAG TPA: hypothetical protein VFL55_12940 [Acetobacteraceae bacterium]|nr:hypothetical protein [Acetobacteraceae bacterium]
MASENHNGGAAGSSDRVFDLIKRRGPLRSAEIAAALNTTQEALRRQLVRLFGEGLVTATIAAEGVGRPAAGI